MNENSGKKRREWVKNAAIIFLSVMLVLTFFSNTFMNYSLPEVAAQYVQSGTITAKIRGTGTVESGDPYNVKISETRTISSVLVKTGDKVEKGDPLFLLEDKESKELTDAQAALDKAMLDFELALLSGDISNSTFQNVQNGNVASINTYQSRIVAAEAEIDRWQKQVDEATNAINQLKTAQVNVDAGGTPDTGSEQNKVNAAQAALNSDEVKIAKDKISEWQAAQATCQATIDKYNENIASSVSGNGFVNQVTEDEYQLALKNREQYQSLINERQAFINNNPDKVKAYDEKVKALADANKALADKQNSKENSTNSLTVQTQNWQTELDKRNIQLKAAQDTKEQLLKDISTELNLDYQLDSLQKQRDDIAKLQENAVGASIEAPISGTITSVTVKAGDEAQPDTALVTMQPEGKGFTMSFSVTNDQAKRLSVGDKADLVNSWRYSDMDITLASIKPDTTDPGQKKLLTFDITGDEVTPGQSLNVSVGQKSANYDLIVPNSAIREDSNGKFILIVESKSSPLGNRYVATRVDVEVLASDDTQSAVSGALYGSEFVITTSTQPVEAGKLVRLANNS
ncbi:HlyD family efflux transporter periplasmic adaptor subunit [Waltera sp.]|jgi:multidrug resistance efflux pump|uniref:HlyD family efflux transporter periplasmic adaptor subunit n=1 Tax=Waltera TaxID=2815781 RepID=UPI00303F7F26